MSTPYSLKFPGSLDDRDSIGRPSNDARGILAAPLLIGEDSLTVTETTDADEFLISGSMTIDPETPAMEIVYFEKAGDTFINLQRGREGTVESDHAAGAIVEQRITAGWGNQVCDAIIALEEFVFDLDTELDGKSDIGHTHVIGDISGLQLALDAKANLSHTHTVGDISGFAAAVATIGDALYSPLGHVHSFDSLIGKPTTLAGYGITDGVPNTRTVNGHPLSNDVVVTPGDLSLVIGINVQAWDADLDAIGTLSGTSGLLRKTAANTWALDTNTYLTANQAITLTGDVTGGPGTTSITTTIGVGKVTNAMLAGSIAFSKLVGSDITIAESQVTGLVSDLALKAPLASPTLTGVPVAPTATAGTNTTQIATTAFVTTAVGAVVMPTGANPTASVGLSAVNGGAATFLRSDGAPALSQAIVPTWSGLHTFQTNPVITNAAPGLVFTDTTPSAKSLTIAVDANIANLRESAGAPGSLLILDLANNRVGVGTASPSTALQIGSTSAPLTISCPGAATNSETFGASATASASSSLAVGKSASAGATSGGFGDTAVGSSAIADGAFGGGGNQATAFGSGASAKGNKATAIGGSSTATNGAFAMGYISSATGVRAFAMGYTSSANFDYSVAIGSFATATAANQLVFGSQTDPLSEGYIGRGVTATGADSFVLNSSGGSGSNKSGAILGLAGGKGTGNALGGEVQVKTSDKGASGSTLQQLTSKLTIKPGLDNTNAVNTLAVLSYNAANGGTTTSGYGAEIRSTLRVASTNDKDAMAFDWQLNNAALATYTVISCWHAYDFGGKRECFRAASTGTASAIGFLGAAAVVRPASYTLAGSATRTFPTDPSTAFSGIDNLQIGSVYAQVSDLNTLRSAFSSLLGVVRQMATDLGSTSGFGLLQHS